MSSDDKVGNRSDWQPRIWQEEQINLPALIQHLSTHASFPCSAHIRNHLLAQYGAAVCHPALKESTESDPDPWRTYRDYRHGARVAAIGDVPGAILRTGTTSDLTQQAVDDGLWALVIVFPSYAPGWVTLSEADERETGSMWNAIRTTLWLSSERPLQGPAPRPEAVRNATTSEQALLQYIFQHYLPSTVAQLAQQQPSGSIRRHGERSIISDLHAVNHVWIQALYAMEADKLSGSGSSWQMVRSNPCLTFSLNEGAAEQLLKRVETVSRWQVEQIGDSEQQMGMILSTNSIRYPSYYLRNRRHNSVLLRDRSDGQATSADRTQAMADTYPKAIVPGAPAGWAYAHDDYSLGSLHVAEPYRSQVRSATPANGSSDQEGSRPPGVGTVCMALMARKLIEAQRRALRMVGVDEPSSLPAPVISDAEQHKEGAVAFHQRTGFQLCSISTWGAYAIVAPA